MKPEPNFSVERMAACGVCAPIRARWVGRHRPPPRWLRTMRTRLPLFIFCLLAAGAPAQNTNDIFRLRATVVSASRLTGVTLANPHQFIPMNPPELTFTVRVKSILPALANYTNGSLLGFSSHQQSLYPTGIVQGATYDFVVSRKTGQTLTAWEPFDLHAPPRLVSQPDGAVNQSQPGRSETNQQSAAAGSGR